MKRPSEHTEQAAVIRWRDQMVETNQYPELCLLAGSMNGQKRTRWEQCQAKQLGIVKGWPDLQLPVARHGYHSLWIEMKFGKNKPTQEQKDVMARLNAAGNLAVVCYSAHEAIETIKRYLGE
jgi:hypothetical protein